jgi:UDP-2,3-diacylglucosamine pyrophosphatase LpxH
MTRLLDALDRLRQTEPELTVWQLGDLIDIWRVGEEPVKSFKRSCDLVNADWSDVLDRFDPGKSKVRRLHGNHDEGFRQDARVGDETILPPDPGHTASNDMLVCHGHQFDPIEILPGFLKASFMRGFTQEVAPHTRDMIAATNPHWMPQPDFSFTPPTRPKKDEVEKFLSPTLDTDGPLPGSDSFNVRRVQLVHRPDANPLEIAANARLELQDDNHPALWDLAKQRAERAGGAGYSVSLVVVGHTHVPRIVLGRQPSGQIIALLDCGAWVGPRFLSPRKATPIHCCQIGVRVGGDLRVYQLGADPYNWPD